MDNTLLVGLTRQMTLRRQMDVVANNIANMSTVGFKVERPAFHEVTERPARHEQGPHPIKFVEDWALARDFSTGALTRTDAPFDVALESDGFFTVSNAAGDVLLTRDGRFAPNADGMLVTQGGQQVLDDTQQPIQLNMESGEPVSITRDGIITQGEQQIGRLGVVEVANRAALEKQGDNQFRLPGDGFEQSFAPLVRQGFLEGSNVKPILEVTRMIETSRAYESTTRMIRSAEELKRKAIEKLAG